jgi:hypothetical protein
VLSLTVTVTLILIGLKALGGECPMNSYKRKPNF